MSAISTEPAASDLPGCLWQGCLAAHQALHQEELHGGCHRWQGSTLLDEHDQGAQGTLSCSAYGARSTFVGAEHRRLVRMALGVARCPSFPTQGLGREAIAHAVSTELCSNPSDMRHRTITTLAQRLEGSIHQEQLASAISTGTPVHQDRPQDISIQVVV